MFYTSLLKEHAAATGCCSERCLISSTGVSLQTIPEAGDTSRYSPAPHVLMEEVQ